MVASSRVIGPSADLRTSGGHAGGAFYSHKFLHIEICFWAPRCHWKLLLFVFGKVDQTQTATTISRKRNCRLRVTALMRLQKNSCFVSRHDFRGRGKTRVLYQGTTSVGPQLPQKLMGFSPCAQPADKTTDFFRGLLFRKAATHDCRRLRPLSSPYYQPKATHSAAERQSLGQSHWSPEDQASFGTRPTPGASSVLLCRLLFPA
jgi:hypothetical protein